jgi:hypothetical protein
MDYSKYKLIKHISWIRKNLILKDSSLMIDTDNLKLGIDLLSDILDYYKKIYDGRVN